MSLSPLYIVERLVIPHRQVDRSVVAGRQPTEVGQPAESAISSWFAATYLSLKSTVGLDRSARDFSEA